MQCAQSFERATQIVNSGAQPLCAILSPPAMFKVTHPQGNAHQSHKELPPHTCQASCYQKDKTGQVWERKQSQGSLTHCWRECELVQPLWTAVWRFLKKLKLERPYDPAIPLLDIYPKVGKHSFEKIRVPLGLSQPYLQQPRYQSEAEPVRTRTQVSDLPTYS